MPTEAEWEVVDAAKQPAELQYNPKLPPGARRNVVQVGPFSKRRPTGIVDEGKTHRVENLRIQNAVNQNPILASGAHPIAGRIVGWKNFQVVNFISDNVRRVIGVDANGVADAPHLDHMRIEGPGGAANRLNVHLYNVQFRNSPGPENFGVQGLSMEGTFGVVIIDGLDQYNVSGQSHIRCNRGDRVDCLVLWRANFNLDIYGQPGSFPLVLTDQPGRIRQHDINGMGLPMPNIITLGTAPDKPPGA